MDHCAVKGCKSEIDLIYLGKPICGKHWDKLANDRVKLRLALGLREDQNGIDIVPHRDPVARPDGDQVPVLRRVRRGRRRGVQQ